MGQIVKFFQKSKYHSTKYIKYFNVYDQLFKKFKNKEIVIVEIGVLNGGSLYMWQKYFGKKVVVFW